MGKNVTISTLPNIGQNYLPKINTSNIFANSLVYDNGTNVILNGTTTHTDYSNARLVVNNSSNSYIEIRSTGGQSALALTTATSTSSNYPTVEIFNSANFGIVGYRPGVVSSNYIMYYELGSSTNRRLTFQTEGVNRLIINQDGTSQFTSALSGTSASFSSFITAQSTGGSGLRIYGSSGTNQWDIYLNSTNLRFSDNTGTGSVVFDRPATFSSSVRSNTYFQARLDGSSTIEAGAAFEWANTAGNRAWVQQLGASNELFYSYYNGTSWSSPLVTILNSGNVGIGTSSPNSYNANADNLVVGTTSGANGITIVSDTTSNGSLYFADGTTGSQQYRGWVDYAHNGDIMTIGTGGAEKMRIDSSAANVVTLRGTQGTQGSYFSSIEFNNSGNVAAAIRPIRYNDETAADLSFWTREYLGSLTQRMTITRGGQLCLTATAPKDPSNYGAARTFLTVQAKTGAADRGAYLELIGTGGGNPNYWNGAVAFSNTNSTYYTAQIYSFTDTGGNYSGNLIFSTNANASTGADTERMRITSGGDIQTYITPTKDTKIQWYNTSTSTVQAYIYANGNPDLIAVCGGSGGVKLTSGATSWVSNSDIRNKDIIEPITDALSKISGLSTIIYKFKDDTSNTRRSGLIAQEVNDILPEAVYIPTKEQEMWGVRYAELIPLLTKAIQELKAENDSLISRIELLENK